MGANRSRRQARNAAAHHESSAGKLAFAIIFAATFAVAMAGATTARADQSVATIDGDPVSSEDYIAYFKAYARSKLYHGGSKERLRELAAEALDNLIIDRLLQQEATRWGLTADDAKVAERMAQITAKYENRPEWPEIKERLPAIEAELRADAQVEALNAQITTVAPPTEDDLRRFYDARPELFTQPPAFDVDLILIGVPPFALARDWEVAGETADSVVAQLAAGASFAELAARHSTHDTANLGGKLGKIHLGQLPEEAQSALDKLAPGGSTDAVRTLEGYAILRLNDRDPAIRQPYASVRDRVEAIYMRETAATQWSDFLRSLRASANIETGDVAALVEKTLAGE